MLSLIIFIVVNALFDSLNPVTIAVHIYLLTTHCPILRTISFMLGIFVAYFLGGILIELGLDKVITNLFTNPGLIDFILQIILGIVLVWFGYKYHKSQETHTTIKPRSLKVIHTFLLGFMVTGTDIPTALPYLAAIGRIVQENLPMTTVTLLLTIYILIYQLPLIVLLGMYICLRNKMESKLLIIEPIVKKWNRRLMVIFFILLGLLLIFDGIAAIFGYPLL